MKLPFSGHSQKLQPMPILRGREVNFGRFGLFSMLGVWFLSLSVAQLKAQNGFHTGNGSWHEPSLWSTGKVPVADEEIRIGSPTPITVTISTGDATSGTVFLAYSSGQTGSVTVENARTWNVSDYVYLGFSGTGNLLVQGAGQVKSASTAIGNDPGSSGAATVTGVGSLWENSENLFVGNNSNGTLDVENGGKVISSYTAIGVAGTGTGVITVSGSGSLLQSGAEGMIVGGLGKGTLNIEAGGKVSSGGDLIDFRLGDFAGSTGEVTVTGAGSLLEVKTTTTIGNQGQGTLKVENGGTMTSSSDTFIGFYPSGEGEVTVTGSNSQWTVSGILNVGVFGKGALNIEAGGKVVSTSLGAIAVVAGGTGEVTVTGSNSLWQNNVGLDVGYTGNATLTVKDGGKVTVAGDNTKVGLSEGGIGAVIVTGSGSLMQNSRQLILGSGGEGSLDVADGGKVTASTVTLGTSSKAASKGTVILSGSAGSRGVLETASVLRATTSSKLTFDGGVLRATGTQTNFLQSFAAGDVLIDNGGAFVDTAGFNVTIATALQNVSGKNGGLTKLGGGRLTLTGNSTYSGITSIEEGSLRVSGGLGGAVAIRNGATLDGSGTTGAVTVEKGGTIAPGNSAGTLHTGSQTWNGGGIYLWEVNAITGTPGTQWDLLDVNGTLSLASSTADPFVIALKGNLSALNAETIYSWTILRASEGFDASFDTGKIAFDLSQFLGLYEGMAFSLAIQDHDLVLQLAAVPEPGQVALLLTAVATVLIFSRRKRILPEA